MKCKNVNTFYIYYVIIKQHFMLITLIQKNIKIHAISMHEIIAYMITRVAEPFRNRQPSDTNYSHQ